MGDGFWEPEDSFLIRTLFRFGFGLGAMLVLMLVGIILVAVSNAASQNPYEAGAGIAFVVGCFVAGYVVCDLWLDGKLADLRGGE